jgi:SAM-dependent methyltransferase
LSIGAMLARTGLRYELIHAWGALVGRRFVNVGLIDEPSTEYVAPEVSGGRPYDRLWAAYLEAVPSASARDVLEVGCGRGLGLQRLAGRLTGLRLVGVDRSRVAQFVGRRAGLDIRQGLYQHLPFADKSFDAIVAVEALLYGDIAEGLLEMHRVIRPGGHLLVAQFMSCTAEEAQRQLAEAWRWQGFALAHFTDLTDSARRSVIANEPRRRGRIRYLPSALKARFSEYLSLKGSRRYDDWISGRECCYAAVYARV